MTYYPPTELLPLLRRNPASGLYYIHAVSDNTIRSISQEFYHEFIVRAQLPNPSPDPLIIYVGKAEGRLSLYQRLEEELYRRRSRTFFRGLGGVMGKDPMRATTLYGVKNYCFESPEKDEIIHFIENYLEIGVVLLSTEKTKNAERHEIKRYYPIFNTTYNPFPSSIVSENRVRCRMYAGEYLLSVK